MIAIFNSLPVVEGAADEVAGLFAGSGGYVKDFPGFVSMEVLKSESEVLVITRWEDQSSFDAWVKSEEFRKAHSGAGGSSHISGRPTMTTYDVAVQRFAD